MTTSKKRWIAAPDARGPRQRTAQQGLAPVHPLGCGEPPTKGYGLDMDLVHPHGHHTRGEVISTTVI